MQRLTLALMILSLSIVQSSLADEKPTKPSPTLGFELKNVQPPDAQKGTPVARLFYEYIYAADLMEASPQLSKEGVDRLTGAIFGKLRQRYQAEHKLEATPEEISQFVLVMKKGNQDDASFEALGKMFVEGWKIDRSLYKQYGGTVIFQQANPLEPVGAYRKFLEAMEETKVFEIYDAANRKQFWHYFLREHPFQNKGKIDFDTPWWLQKPQ